MVNPFSDYSEFNDDVDFESNNSRGNDQNAWYKGNKGQTDRGAFVFFHRYDVNAVKRALKENPRLSRDEQQAVALKALESRASELGQKVGDLTNVDVLDRRTVKFKKMRAHYQEGMGFVVSRLGLDGYEADKVWKQLPEPRVYYATLIIQYPTDKKGNITRDKETFQNGWQIRPWRLSEPNYEEFAKTNQTISAVSEDQSLATQDFLMECIDQTYQKFKINGAGKALWQSKDTFSQAVLERALPWYEKLMPFREMSTDELRKKLGGETTSGGGGQMGGGGGGSANRQLGSGGGGSAAAGGGDNGGDFEDILSSV
jgi:hypothetical protein